MPDIGANEKDIEIDSEAVKSAISELPDVVSDLGEIKKNLDDVSEPLEATWIGTARGSYMKAVFYMEEQIKKIEMAVGDLHGLLTLTCDNRLVLDQEVADAAVDGQANK